MYAVRYFRTYVPGEHFVAIASNLPTIEDAKLARQASGDLVVEQESGNVVTNPNWLWDWELNDSDCYARKMIARHLAIYGPRAAYKER